MKTVSQAKTYINYLIQANGDDDPIEVKEKIAAQLLVDVNEEKEKE